MSYVKVNEDGSLLYPYNLQNLRNDLRNIILPKDITVEILNSNNIYYVEEIVRPDYNIETQYIVKQRKPVLQDNKWLIGYDILEYDTSDKEAKIREGRDSLLSETDWTQLTDIPYNTKISWQTYRQALRDITNQEGFPDNVVWPTKPE